MFHDMGSTRQRSTTQARFEIDSATAARDFLRSRGVQQQDIETIWTAIALYTTPGVPQHMHPVVALVTADVEMDMLGICYAEYSDKEREAVCMRIHVLAFQRRHHSGLLRRQQA